MKNFLIENKEWLIGLIASISAFFGGRKMKKSNEKSAELQNLATIREMEKQLFDDMEERFDKLQQINTDLQNLISQQKIIISEQKIIITKQNRFLNTYIKKY